MGTLSAAQMAVVGEPPQNAPEDVEWPEIRYEIDDLGDQPDFDFMRWFNQHQGDEGVSSVAGYCAVVRKDGKWFAGRSYYGGGHGSTAYETRDEAVACIASSVDSTARFWMEKVGWKIAGDQHMDRDRWGRHAQQVIRCDGQHYTIGREPSDSDYAANNQYGVFGFGGHQMAWRLLATGETVMGRNCWGQGRIPAEFRDLLPDNAVRVESPQEKAQKEAAAKWKAQWAAQQKARAEAQAAVAPFSASGREHPLPDQVLMVVEDMDEDYDAAIGDVRTVTRDLDAATVMTSSYQGYVGDNVGDDWHRPRSSTWTSGRSCCRPARPATSTCSSTSRCGGAGGAGRGGHRRTGLRGGEHRARPHRGPHAVGEEGHTLDCCHAGHLR